MSTRSRQSDPSPQRTPWVTGALSLACVAATLWVQLARSDGERALAAELDAAEAYLRSRPYLELPPLLEARIPPSQAARLAGSWEKRRLERSAPPIPPRIRASEQAELEQLLAAAARLQQARPARRFGLPAAQAAPQRHLTHLFFHEGWLALAAGLLALLALGPPLERAWGAALFAGAAATAALGSGLAFRLGNPGVPEPLIGISGLAAGLLGAFLVRFAGDRELAFAPRLLASALLLGLPSALGWQWSLARGLGTAPAEPGWNPSGWALAGGLASGVMAALAVRGLGLERRLARAGGDVEPAGAAPDARLERALEDRGAGRLEPAFNRIRDILRRDPQHLGASLALWEVANDLGRPRAAVPAILRMIRDAVRRGDRESAVRYWLELVACGVDADAEPALLLRVVPWLSEAGEREAAVRALNHALLRSGSDATAVAKRVAREAAPLDARTAETAAWRALGSLDLDLHERQALEALLAELQPALPSDAEEEEEIPQPVEGRSVFSAADLIEEPLLEEPDGCGAPPDPRPGPVEFQDASRALERVLAVPCQLDEEGLWIEVEGAGKKRVRFDRIDAVAVAAVEGLGPKPVILIDLVLNWMSLADEPLRVIRLRSSHFDPRRVFPGRDAPLDALRGFVERLLRESQAAPLPDLQSVRGVPFAGYASLAAYQRDVLMVRGSGRVEPVEPR